MSEGTGATGGGESTAAAPTSSAPANDNGAPVAANDNGTPPEPRHKVKLGGEERELTMAELQKLAEKGTGAEKAFREAARMREEVTAYLDRLPKDIPGALTQLIGDKSRAARTVMEQLLRDPQTRMEIESFLVETYEYEGLPQEERAKRDEHRSLKEQAEELKKIKAAEAQQREEQMSEQFQQQLDGAFKQALQQVGAPLSKANYRAMVAQVEAVYGKQQLTMPLIIEMAKRAHQENDGEVRGYLASLDADRLAELLGDEKLSALRKRELDRLRPAAPVAQRMPGNGKGRAEQPKSSKPRVGTHDFFRRLRGEG
jgi:hypothetical protein